ncbi:hypothetical protein C1H46_024512 [Malus baccata]|uniref:Uncharacterized protein n=1 Tax=Malus baccata TaxID=106549 RepID=A0A540LU17_MALBA|nr:hypothetical protein C1H46_024512 [Malus baccata]
MKEDSCTTASKTQDQEGARLDLAEQPRSTAPCTPVEPSVDSCTRPPATITFFTKISTSHHHPSLSLPARDKSEVMEEFAKTELLTRNSFASLSARGLLRRQS